MTGFKIETEHTKHKYLTTVHLRHVLGQVWAVIDARIGIQMPPCPKTKLEFRGIAGGIRPSTINNNPKN